MPESSDNGLWVAKIKLVFWCLLIGVLTFFFSISEGFELSYSNTEPKLGDLLIGVAAVFVYPLLGALIIPVMDWIKFLATKKPWTDSNPYNRLMLIAIWPIILAITLIVFPPLMLINSLID